MPQEIASHRSPSQRPSIADAHRRHLLIEHLAKTSACITTSFVCSTTPRLNTAICQQEHPTDRSDFCRDPLGNTASGPRSQQTNRTFRKCVAKECLCFQPLFNVTLRTNFKTKRKKLCAPPPLSNWPPLHPTNRTKCLSPPICQMRGQSADAIAIIQHQPDLRRSVYTPPSTHAAN